MQQEIMLARTCMKISIVWISVERATLVPSLLTCLYAISVAVSAFGCHRSKQDPHPDWIPWALLSHK